MANKLKREKQRRVIASLVEGPSIRSTERMTGVHRDTIMRLIFRVGKGSQRLMDEKLQHLKLGHIQMDEIWGYVGKKQRHIRKTDDPNKTGDTWAWVALDTETKLVPTHHIGKRTMQDAEVFLTDLASRLDSRVQLSADKLPAYVERQNLTMRMHIRRLTRLTNAFSKKLENHKAAIAMWFTYYNIVRPHSSLKTVPAVRAGVIKWRWSLNELLDYTLAKS